MAQFLQRYVADIGLRFFQVLEGNHHITRALQQPNHTMHGQFNTCRLDAPTVCTTLQGLRMYGNS
jgi:hypothetical protein